MKKIFIALSCTLLLVSCGPNTTSPAPSTRPTPPSTPLVPPAIDGTLPELDIKGLKEFSFASFSKPFSLVGDFKPAIIGKTYIITSPGTYTLSGHLEAGSVQVKKGVGKVKLILDGVSIRGNNAAIFIKSLNEVAFEVKIGTKNYLDDGSSADFESFYQQEAEDEPKGTICSKSKLDITGDGELYIISEAKDIAYIDPLTNIKTLESINGIQSKKSDLSIKDTKVFIKSVSNGIKVKGNLNLESTTIEISSDKDGIEIERNLELVGDISSGNYSAKSSDLFIKAKNDGIQSEVGITIDSGQYSIKTGDGNEMVDDLLSHKALKAESEAIDIHNYIDIISGTFDIDSGEDGLSSDDDISINSGRFAIKSADDAIHAKAEMVVLGEHVGIYILKAYEGIKARRLSFDSGFCYIATKSDGINVGGGKDLPKLQPIMEATIEADFSLKSGVLVIDSEGDGLDVNGKIKMTGGTLLVNGPLNSLDSAIDYNESLEITGGTIIASGPKETAKAPTEKSTTNSLLIKHSSLNEAKYLAITDSKDKPIIVYKLSKPITSLVFSSNTLINGSEFNIYSARNYTGENNVFGICTDGILQNKTKLGSVRVETKLSIFE